VLAQIGATIGREFSHELLLAVSGKTDADLTEDLPRLLASGLIYRRGAPPDAVYFFKHALIQDAAYDTLLRSKRQQLHAAVAETILTRFPGIAANQPEVIAHHLTAAEDFKRAVEYWFLAGKAQIQASADLEAIGHLQRGIALLSELDDDTQRLQTELKLQTALIGPLVAVKGPFSPEVAGCCERGLALSAAGMSATAFPFLYGQFTHSVSTGKLRHAAEIGRRFIKIAEDANYASGVVVGHRLLGLALLARGEFEDARSALETALAIYRPERDDNLTLLFGQNVKVNSQTVLSLVLYCLGECEAARRIARECLTTAAKLKHPHTTAISIVYAGLWVPWLDGDIEEMQAQADRLVSIATEFGLQLFAPVGRFFIGLALYEKGQVEAGFAQMQGAIAAFDRGNYKLAVPAQLCLLARAKLSAGQLTEARALSARARTLMEECEEFWFGPEILSVEGEIAARADPPDAERAKSFIDQAIRLAEQLRAGSLEARARRVRDRLFEPGFALAP
jgi:tetratricopeptide (TPR) repeat protein